MSVRSLNTDVLVLFCVVTPLWFYLLYVYVTQVISAAQLKSEEFERALSLQHTAMASDEKGRLALKLLTFLSGGGDETGAVHAGEEVLKMWTEAHAPNVN